MVVRGHPALSLSRQCRLLSIGRSSLYYEPKGESVEALALMRRIDELFLKYPLYGARQMVRHLRREGVQIGRRGPARRTPSTGFTRIFCGVWRSSGRTTSGAPTSPTSRGAAASSTWWRSWIGRAGTCLAWRLSNRLDAGFCTDALEEALAGYGTPEIFNTDQGSQLTGFAFTGCLREAGIRISMDGRGRCMDNIFIDRLWRSLKYEAVYLHDIVDGFTARRVIAVWIGFYNIQRPHSALGGRTPAEAYRGDTPVDMMDKPLRALTTYPQAQQQQQEERFKGILAA